MDGTGGLARKNEELVSLGHWLWQLIGQMGLPFTEMGKNGEG